MFSSSLQPLMNNPTLFWSSSYQILKSLFSKCIKWNMSLTPWHLWECARHCIGWEIVLSLLSFAVRIEAYTALLQFNQPDLVNVSIFPCSKYATYIMGLPGALSRCIKFPINSYTSCQSHSRSSHIYKQNIQNDILQLQTLKNIQFWSIIVKL